MYRRDVLLRVCRQCCEATNGVLLDSSPNMRALCAVRAVLREAAGGRAGGIAFATGMAKQQFLHDSTTGEIRPITDEDIEYVLTSDPVEAVEEFYQTYDVLSLQDAVADFKADEVAAAVGEVLEMIDVAAATAEWGGEEDGGGSGVFDSIRTILGPATNAAHPLNSEGMGMYREGVSAVAAQVYGLLTLSVLYDLANDEFRRGTSLFSDRFSNEFGELVETFDVGDEEGVVEAIRRVYGMLVAGEVTL